jgi:hypothetical protein
MEAQLEGLKGEIDALKLGLQTQAEDAKLDALFGEDYALPPDLDADASWLDADAPSFTEESAEP